MVATIGIRMWQTKSLETIDTIEEHLAASVRGMLGFALLWSRDEPERVGEVALMPGPKSMVRAVLGREGPVDDNHDDSVPRLAWMRQRPGRSTPTGELRSPYISRDQLAVTVQGPRLLGVENIGRSPLIHDGYQVHQALLTIGDIIELHKRALLICVERPLVLPGDPDMPVHTFGEADADGIVGESLAAWELRRSIGFMAPRNGHVLVRGASGTGKELVAQAIHRLSPRCRKTLISRNAATFPETLIDAELFGNARGYPNAGMPERPGLVGEADGSTLFLDEFAELPQALQTHLLRLLDAGEYTRLGDSRPRRSDFRLVAATNRPESALKEDVLARFRLRIEIPGLTARREDIPLVARHLLRSAARRDPDIARRYFPEGDPAHNPRISRKLVEHLVRHRYSTHVRELDAMLWRAMSNSRGDELSLWPRSDPAMPAADAAAPESTPPAAPRSDVDPSSIPPEVIQECLDRHDGQQEPVWRELGLSSRHVLTRLVRRHGLHVRGRTR